MVSSASKVLNEEIISWITEVTQQPVLRVRPVVGGKNNQAAVIITENQSYFLKQYFADHSHRFQRETDFVDLLGQHIPGPDVLSYDQVQNVTQLIAAKHKDDKESALYTLLPGKIPNNINKALVMQAAQFVADINQPGIKQQAGHILPARGGLGLAGEFIRDIERRLTSFMYILDSELPEDTEENKAERALMLEFKDFLEHEFHRVFKMTERKVMAYFGENLQLPFQRVLSPSDFGFHNTLLDEKTGLLYFFDFEYAGWDSAEKLITDFFAQPRFIIDPNWLPEFISRAIPEDNESMLEHCQVLLPLAHLKWALIFLNDFKHPDSQRRAFASEPHKETLQNHIERKRQQLEKAKKRAALI